MRATLKDIASHFPTAIVSGRCIDKVYNFVQLAELYYAGSHGMDIKGPTKSRSPKKVLDVIVSITNDMGPFSLDNFRKNNLSASWRVVGIKTSNATIELNQAATNVRQEKQKGKEGRSLGGTILSDGLAQWTDSPAQLARSDLKTKKMIGLAALFEGLYYLVIESKVVNSWIPYHDSDFDEGRSSNILLTVNGRQQGFCAIR